MKNKNKQLILLFIFIFQSSILFLCSNAIFKEKDVYEAISTNPELSDITVGNYTVPGVSGSISLSQVIKIGILDDMNHISGDHAWKGALLAAREINEAGGVLINSSIFYVGLVSEDTEEANPILQTSKGVTAANIMINDHDPYFITGGFRTEAILAYQEVIMDAKIPFIGTGCSFDGLSQNVLTNYARYKYFFRVSPLNSTSLTNELVDYHLSLTDYLNNTYEAPTIKIGILREDYPWTIPIANDLKTLLPTSNPNISIVDDIAFSVGLTATEMGIHLSSLDSAGAQIVIPIISGGQAPAGPGIIMNQQYALIQPRYLLAGINVLSQIDTYWDDTAGTCRYEITMQGLHNTSKTTLTIPFWNKFIGEYGNEPYYIGTGSYDAVRLLVNASIETQSFKPDTIVANLEKINTSNPFIGVAGKLAFTNSHDLQEGWPFGTSLFCQWQMDGKKVVLPSWGSIYPDILATGTLSIPYWGINNLVADYSHQLPGDFVLSSNADDPDTDGAFDISWTSSVGVDNYSLYMSNESITYVSKKHTLIAKQDVNSTVPISGLRTGAYYFTIVAYNETGQTFSNNINVSVQIPPPGDFVLTTDADDPDTDGVFNLSWTDSSGADNYSIYKYTSYIAEINNSLTEIAYQTAMSPFLINESLDGEYNYIVVADNEKGKTLSNNVVVSIEISEIDKVDKIISGYDLWIIISAFSIGSLILFKRYLKPKKKI